MSKIKKLFLTSMLLFPCFKISGPWSSSNLNHVLIESWKFFSLLPSGMLGHLPSLYNYTYSFLNS